MREWLSWWSTTLPRSGSRVRVPSRALFIYSGSLDSTGTSAVFVLSLWGRAGESYPASAFSISDSFGGRLTTEEFLNDKFQNMEKSVDRL